MVLLRSVAGIKEYRIIQLVDGPTVKTSTIFFFVGTRIANPTPTTSNAVVVLITDYDYLHSASLKNKVTTPYLRTRIDKTLIVQVFTNG